MASSCIIQKKAVKTFFCGVAISCLAGCAVTNINSIADRGAAKSNYLKILVISTFPDLIYKDAIENAFIQAFSLRNIAARPGSSVLPPTREYTHEEISGKLGQNRIDGLLIVALQGWWEEQGYIPGSSMTTGTASVIGNTIVYSQRQQNAPGYSYSKPRANFDTRFLDGQMGNVVWRSTSHTSGNALADFATVANSLARTTVDKMLMDRIIFRPRATSSSDANNHMTVQATPTEILARAEALYAGGSYQSSIACLSELKASLEQNGEMGLSPTLLAKVYCLWGACYIKAWNRQDLAREHFNKALEYKSDFVPSDVIDERIIGIFGEYRREVMGSETLPQQTAKAAKSSIPDIKARPIIRAGIRIRIIKARAPLHVGADQTSETIRELPLGVLLEVVDYSEGWVKVKLPPDKDGLIIVGFVDDSFVTPDI